MREVDVAIIGAGTAGLAARSEVAKVTDKYVVIDAGPTGTTCARVGCMPSKAFIEAANSFASRRRFANFGIQGGSHLQISTRELMLHVRSLRDRFVKSIHAEMEMWRASHFIQKRAKFRTMNELDLGDEVIRAKRIIVATGSHPVLPRDWESVRSRLIDTDQFFELTELPKRMAVLGAGAIGLELGQALARVGVETTIIGKGSKSLAGLTDPEIIAYATEKISEDSPISFAGVEQMSLANDKLVIQFEGRSIEVEKALLAVGRQPNLDGLGLEELGLRDASKRIPSFGAGTFRIGGTPIYIAGDVSGERPILHEAADEGHIAGYNAVRPADQCFARRVHLAITFSSPNIAVVGQTFAKLAAEKADFVYGEVSFEGQGRAILKGEERGLLKIFAAKATGKILGAEIFAPEGEHLAHLLSWAISCRMTIEQALAMPFYHPVLEEGIRTALRRASQKLPQKARDLEISRCEDPPIGC